MFAYHKTISILMANITYNKKGLSMGASVSPYMENLYMNALEQKLFSKNLVLIKKNFLVQIDGVFCVWTGTRRQLYAYENL